MAAVKNGAKHSAPGQYLGFALQPVRLCYYLLSASPTSSVLLEHDDDVSIHQADGVVVLEQTKSALKHNPLTDWSTDLWKTIANWLDHPRSESGNSYRLYVTPPHPLGGFASRLNDASSSGDVEAFVADVREGLKGITSKPLRKLVERFLSAKGDEQLYVVSRMSIQSSDSDPVDPIRSLLKTAVDPNAIDTLCAYAIGEAKEQADSKIRRGEPAQIQAEAFQRQFREIAKRNNLPGLLVSFNATPPLYEVHAVLAERPTFIRQLELIEASSDQKIRAVGDYLRSAADRTTWADAGMLFSRDMIEWDSELTTKHQFIKSEVDITHSQRTAEDKGKLVYLRCAQSAVALTGRVVPSHFVHGSFNDLADQLTLGWHPDFKAILKEEG